MKHRKEFVQCSNGVIYNIPFTCGREYVGQTGQCLNVRLRAYQSSLKGALYSHLAIHCSECPCKPKFEDTIIIDTHAKRSVIEIIEAYRIKTGGNGCVSQHSIWLPDGEIAFLDKK